MVCQFLATRCRSKATTKSGGKDDRKDVNKGGNSSLPSRVGNPSSAKRESTLPRKSLNTSEAVSGRPVPNPKEGVRFHEAKDGLPKRLQNLH